MEFSATVEAAAREFIENNPAQYYKTFLREMKEKNKLCDAFSSYMDDIAAMEDNFGKSLVKAGNHSYSNEEWPNETIQTWNRLCTSSERLGKQHIGFSMCISQSVARTFVEQGKENARKIQDIDATIASILDVLIKESRLFDKKKAKYHRLVHDIEVCLHARDSSINELAKGNLPNDPSFLNRSLTKMLGMATPTDVMRKQHDRIQHLLRELDLIEASLALSTEKLKNLHVELLQQLRGASKDFIAMEHSRLSFLRESLFRFCQACAGMFEHSGQILNELRNSTLLLESTTDFDSFEKQLSSIASSIPPASPTGQDNEDSNSAAESTAELATVFHVIDKMKYSIEHLKVLAGRSVSTFTEMSETEKSFGAKTSKLFEKHGYTAKATKSFQNIITTAELVSLHEEPKTKELGWNAVVTGISRFAEAHMVIAEVIADKCSVIIDSTLRKLDILKRDTQEKQVAAAKKVEMARASLSKVETKLKRVQRELKGRKNKLNDGSSSIEEDTSVDIDESVHIDEQKEIKDVKDVKHEANKETQKSVMHGLESLGSALGVAVKGAQTSERNANRINVLEDEEKAYIEVIQTAKESVSVVLESSVSEMRLVVDAVKVDIKKHLSELKVAYQMFLDCYMLGHDICRKAIDKVREDSANIDIEQDLLHFLNNIQSASAEKSAMVNIPIFEVFVPLHHDAIEQERNNRPDELDEEKKRRGSIGEDVAGEVQFTNESDDCNEDVLSPRESLRLDSGDQLLVDEMLQGSVTTELSITRSESCPPLSVETESLMHLEKVKSEPILSIVSDTLDESMCEERDTAALTVAPIDTSTPLVHEDIALPSSPISHPFSPSQLTPPPTPQQQLSPLLEKSPEKRPRPASTPDITMNRMNISPYYGVAPREETFVSPELVKFGLPTGEKILEYFSCALYPKKGIMSHGRMFITNHYLTFSGWPEIKVVIPLKDITSVEKTNSLFFVPNALLITTCDEEYFFSSFLDRDLCYSMLNSMVEIEKKLEEIHNQSMENGDVDSFKTVEPVSLAREVTDIKVVEETEEAYNIQALFNKDIIMLHEAEIYASASEVWEAAWKTEEGYRLFLQSEGDFDIEMSEWEPHNGVVDGDAAKLNYQYKRKCKYMHPRTSMLMFGPKNATANQMQYLHLPAGINIATQRPQYGFILTCTQFDGIPMADVFRVLQYWSFERAENRVILRMGMYVHFVKSTLLKGQVIAGSKDELTILVKKWVAFITARVNETVVTEIFEEVPTRRTSISSRRGSFKIEAPPTILSPREPDVVYKKPVMIIIGLLVMFILLQMYTIVIYQRHMSKMEKLIENLTKMSK